MSRSAQVGHVRELILPVRQEHGHPYNKESSPFVPTVGKSNIQEQQMLKVDIAAINKEHVLPFSTR
jgi:hypothetical protein